ncbi:MAG: pyridoxine 5'-phosphate synthase, partial [Pseudomonadota bacterium]|nr:pyridoxine 5'-phosphate synthase [Pseudomonadota bacterium]
GADFITLHLREDRRHIQDADVHLLRERLPVKMNLEMAVTGEMIAIATQVRPADCCLVPERREELTTEGGLDVAGAERRIADAVARLTDAGCRVSLFVDPDPEQLEAAARTGAPLIELHTGAYAEQLGTARDGELARLRRAALRARELGLAVNAGHGLHRHNLEPIVALPGVEELNIGHAIVARALFVGMREAVSEIRRAMDGAR